VALLCRLPFTSAVTPRRSDCARSRREAHSRARLGARFMPQQLSYSLRRHRRPCRSRRSRLGSCRRSGPGDHHHARSVELGFSRSTHCNADQIIGMMHKVAPDQWALIDKEPNGSWKVTWIRTQLMMMTESDQSRSGVPDTGEVNNLFASNSGCALCPARVRSQPNACLASIGNAANPAPRERRSRSATGTTTPQLRRAEPPVRAISTVPSLLSPNVFTTQGYKSTSS
jgi:hypothetical protein